MLLRHFNIKESPSSNKRPKTKKQSTTATKQQKQVTCHNWLCSMKQNTEVVCKFEDALMQADKIEKQRDMMLNSAGLKSRLLEGEVLEVFTVLQEMIDKMVVVSEAKEVELKAQTCQTRKTAEMTWTERAQVRCFIIILNLGTRI